MLEMTKRERAVMAATKFERHRQPWRQDEIQKLHTLAGKGMSLKAIAKALTRSEESVKDRARLDRVTIAKLR
jgi:DNA-binding NarL/FixJ family response regulator